MIELIHKHPVLIKALLTLVTVSFVLTGGWLLGKESTSDWAAKVGKRKITLQTYQDAENRMQEFYRKIYQGNMPEDLMKKLNVGKKALDALVDKEIILQEAAKQGISVSDSELASSIKDNKSFQAEGGGFSKERYTTLLKYNGMTPSMYEHDLRDELTVEKFRNMVKESAYLSDNEVREAYKKQLAAQGKEFKEEDYQAQKENVWRMLNSSAQEKAMASFMDGLKKNYKVEINPSVQAQS